jgi:hypothetical protein
MISARDLIRVLRFPLQEVSDWISLARPSQLDYGAVAEISLYLAGGVLRGLPLLYFPGVRGIGILGSSWKKNSRKLAKNSSGIHRPLLGWLR